MSGTARTFNALAAQSSVFAGEKRIKRAIFSDIRINDNKSVSFSLEADLDPKLLTLVPEVTQTVPADDGALTPPPATTTAAQTGAATTTP